MFATSGKEITTGSRPPNRLTVNGLCLVLKYDKYDINIVIPYVCLFLISNRLYWTYFIAFNFFIFYNWLLYITLLYLTHLVLLLLFDEVNTIFILFFWFCLVFLYMLKYWRPALNFQISNVTLKKKKIGDLYYRIVCVRARLCNNNNWKLI